MTFDQDPDPTRSNRKVEGRFIIAVSSALSQVMDESDWKKFALAHGLERRITSHPRFLRSLQWGDPDHEGLVLDLVNDLYRDDDEAFFELFQVIGVRPTTNFL